MSDQPPDMTLEIQAMLHAAEAVAKMRPQPRGKAREQVLGLLADAYRAGARRAS